MYKINYISNSVYSTNSSLFFIRLIIYIPDKKTLSSIMYTDKDRDRLILSVTVKNKDDYMDHSKHR